MVQSDNTLSRALISSLDLILFAMGQTKHLTHWATSLVRASKTDTKLTTRAMGDAALRRAARCEYR